MEKEDESPKLFSLKELSKIDRRSNNRFEDISPSNNRKSHFSERSSFNNAISSFEDLVNRNSRFSKTNETISNRGSIKNIENNFFGRDKVLLNDSMKRASFRNNISESNLQSKDEKELSLEKNKIFNDSKRGSLTNSQNNNNNNASDLHVNKNFAKTGEGQNNMRNKMFTKLRSMKSREMDDYVLEILNVKHNDDCVEEGEEEEDNIKRKKLTHKNNIYNRMEIKEKNYCCLGSTNKKEKVISKRT